MIQRDPDGFPPKCTKASVLAYLAPRIRGAHILPSHIAHVSDWTERPGECVDQVVAQFGNIPLIVRSSAHDEDQWAASMAGHYTSVSNVDGPEALLSAVQSVAASYSLRGRLDEEVLVQPWLSGLASAGVVLTADLETLSPYCTISIAVGGTSGGITSGTEAGATWVVAPGTLPKDPTLRRLILLMDELRQHLPWRWLDVEFGICGERVILFQARQLHVPSPLAGEAEMRARIAQLANDVGAIAANAPVKRDEVALFGVMPDWNPAEIIGLKPRPLAISLYAHLITDSAWAVRRAEYGYQDMRGTPLMVEFQGLPYVDVGISLKSLLPSGISTSCAQSILNHQLDKITDHPELHDKIEFTIALSSATLDTDHRILALINDGVPPAVGRELSRRITELTRRLLHARHTLWRSDVGLIRAFGMRPLPRPSADPIDTLDVLLDRCYRYGTVPFAGIARMAFISTSLLRSMIDSEIMDLDDYDSFMSTIGTVGYEYQRDLLTDSMEDLLQRYGHLRPGTYDIRSPRYDQNPEEYLTSIPLAPQGTLDRRFQLRPAQVSQLDRALERSRLDIGGLQALDIIRESISMREYAKLVFTKWSSQALEQIAAIGSAAGLSRDDLSYVRIPHIRDLRPLSLAERAARLKEHVELGREKFQITESILSPPLLSTKTDLSCFLVPSSAPNFVTRLAASGHVVDLCSISPDDASLTGSIVLVSSADPGYDWIFTRGIAAFVTMYGGSNSHMAIRASELAIPAVIGAGEQLYARLKRAQRATIDCSEHSVRMSP